MMDAPVLYMVRAWVSPSGGERYLEWLERKHMAEVIRQPGFLWARRCCLAQRDDKGWRGYLLLYGLESQAALDAYLESPARQGFWEELKAFDDVHYAERFYGAVDFVVTRD
jgi:antibiotic biosynthesis monooxygenase (ABM) superfamily enzyme